MTSIAQFPLPFPDESIELELSQGHSSTIDKVDTDLMQYRWYITGRDGRYAVRYIPKLNSKLKTTHYLHREIMERVLGRPLLPSEQVDHIDGNPMNNRRSNLRSVTQSQNMQNARKHRDNQSGYKGVSWQPQMKKWRATIRIDGKQKFLGHFDDPKEAHDAYCRAASEHRGDYARFR